MFSSASCLQQLPIEPISRKYHNHTKQLTISAVLQISVTKIKPYDHSYDLVYDKIA